MKEWISQGTPKEGFQTIHILSDSLGKLGTEVAKSAAAIFGNPDPAIEILSDVTDVESLRQGIDAHIAYHQKVGTKPPYVLFYTLVIPELRCAIKEFLEDRDDIIAVDLMDPVVNALQQATGIEPVGHAGAFREVTDTYFKRIEAMEFTIAHDDGARPHELTKADIVLLGVSRSSKTPLSIYLSQLGYRVANIPLDPQTEPPKEVYDVDTRRLFGLMTSPEVLVDVRKRRIAKAAGGSAVANSYADYENVCRDLESSRKLMRKLGCIVVHTENRAIEETAQEILRYYTRFNSKQ